MSAPVGASCPSPLLLRLAPSYSAPRCSCTMRWISGHSTRRGLPGFLSLQRSGSAVSVAHSPSTFSARRRLASFPHFIFSLLVLRLSFRASAGVSSNTHVTEMHMSPSCPAKSPNRAIQRILPNAFAAALIISTALPCSGQDQGETNFRKVVNALSGMWSIRETSDHGEATGEEVWQGGTGGMPLTEEFRIVTASGDKLSDYAAIWWDSKAKKVRGIWCADFNDKGCTPFEVTSRDGDIEMKGEYS